MDRYEPAGTRLAGAQIIVLYPILPKLLQHVPNKVLLINGKGAIHETHTESRTIRTPDRTILHIRRPGGNRQHCQRHERSNKIDKRFQRVLQQPRRAR
jgi:hypothetical protein